VIAPPENFRSRLLRIPRLLLPLPGGKDWLVTDLGNWNMHGGKVFRLTGQAGKPVTLTPLLSNLFMPHGLARGPDGKIYVGEMGRIFRFDPNAAEPQATIETIVTGLPDLRQQPSRHPLAYFIFDVNGDLLVNIGASTDQCAQDAAKDGVTDSGSSCSGSDTGLIRRYLYRGDGRWSASFTVLARGLRNSMALARHSSGSLVQAENSMDFPSLDAPFEEVNLLRDGAHYGWPYCYDMDKATPVWAHAGAMDCRASEHTKPLRLLPPHAAPMNMLYYDGALFPQLRGRLLMTWHSSRPTGGRIAAFAVDKQGIPLLAPNARYQAYTAPNGDDTTSLPYPGPASEPLLLTPGWNNVDGQHPRGAPVGIAVAEDGAIWVADDRNATILRIAPDRP
jgi:glucose/arabinose dehydrogenase